MTQTEPTLASILAYHQDRYGDHWPKVLLEHYIDAEKSPDPEGEALSWILTVRTWIIHTLHLGMGAYSFD